MSGSKSRSIFYTATMLLLGGILLVGFSSMSSAASKNDSALVKLNKKTGGCGNNGHGNDDDGNDSSNPGNSNNGDGTDQDGPPGNPNPGNGNCGGSKS